MGRVGRNLNGDEPVSLREAPGPPSVGLCPGNHESAGKRYSGKTRKGNPHARRLLVQAALAAAKSKKSSLSAQYRRIAARRGKKKAAVAVAHSILVIISHVLRDRAIYQDLGSNYFDERDQHTIQKQLVRRLERLGYHVVFYSGAYAGLHFPSLDRRLHQLTALCLS